MSGNDFGIIFTVCTLRANGAVYALLRIRVILTITLAVGSFIRYDLSLRTCVSIVFSAIHIFTFREVAFLFQFRAVRGKKMT